MTLNADAAASRHGRGRGVKSREGRSVALTLLENPVPVRRSWLATLSERERTFVFSEVQRETGSLYGLWHDDPAGFIEDVLGETMWNRQRQMVEALALPGVKRVAVPAGFGVGKTFSAGRLTAWAGATNAVGTIKVVTTATRDRQVVTQLWPHIKTAVAKGKLPGRTDTKQWVAEDLYGNMVQIAYGFTAPPHDEAAMQGIHGCYHKDVEILTNEGWKFFPDVRGDEQVMSLRKDGVAEWGPITEVTNVEIDGYLNVHDGDRVNFAVTDGHRMLWSPMHYRKPDRLVCPYCDAEVGAKGRSQHERKHLRAGAEKIDSEWAAVAPAERQWQLGSYMDLPQEFFVRRTNTWEGTPLEPIEFLGARKGAATARFSPEDFAAFLGWYVAEGHVQVHKEGTNTTRWTVCIAQNPGDKQDQIAALLDRIGVKYLRVGHSLRFRHKPLARWLQEHCGIGSGEKRVPQIIKDAPQSIIRAFLDTYRMGDGTRHTHPDSARYITSSKVLADDIHELLVKMGTARKMRLMHAKGSIGTITKNGERVEFARKRDVWVVTEAGRPSDSDVKKSNVKRVRHKGPVYCVTTPNETLMVRRNGTPMWCGNTPKLILIVDEAGGIAATIGKGTNNLLTGDAKMLATGNPAMNEPGSWLETLSKEGDDPEEPTTVTVQISALHSPAITGEPTPICRACVPNIDGHTIAGGVPSHLPDWDWLHRTLREYGVFLPDADRFNLAVIREECRKSGQPYLIAKVLAEFPRDVGNQVMPSSWVEAAATSDDPLDHSLCEHELEDDVSIPCVTTTPALGYVPIREFEDDSDLNFLVKKGSWVRLGIDIASDGGDEFAIYRAIGDVVHKRHVSSGAQNADSSRVAAVIMEEIHRATRLAKALGSPRKVRVKVDKNGLGWGTVGRLQELKREGKHDAEIVGVMVSEGTNRDDEAAEMRPYRKRDEMWLAGRFLMKPRESTGVGQLRLRLDEHATRQLSLPLLKNNSSGHTVVESKDSMKKRGLKSPDRAEGVLLAIYEPEPIGKRKGKGLLN